MIRYSRRFLEKVQAVKTAITLVSVSLLAGFMGCTTSRRVPLGTPATGTPRPPSEALEELEANARRARERYRDLTFAEFKAECWREPAECGGKFLVDGDRPILNEKQLREFFENEVKRDPPSRALREAGELVVHSPGGQVSVWSRRMQRSLTYCVSSEFGSRYQEVRDAMESAAGAWEAAADVDFIHDVSQDGECSAGNDSVVFDVRPVDVDGQYLARAFFPNDPRSARNILIDESSFGLSGNLTLVGILRHELGHTLGFRHEHTRPEPGVCFEDDDWRPVTSYDPFSVMHYPQCNGLGDWTLTLTDLDRNGAACVYGPAPGFTIDPSLDLESCREEISSPCDPQTKVFQGSVARSEEEPFGPFSVTPGTVFEANMSGSGDPDLYVRLGRPPTRNGYDCRPYLAGAEESCSLDVPAGESAAYVMVRGYTAGTFTLKVTHVSRRR